MEKEWQELKSSIQQQIDLLEITSRFDITSTTIIIVRRNILREMEKLETKKSLIEAGY